MFHFAAMTHLASSQLGNMNDCPMTKKAMYDVNLHKLMWVWCCVTNKISLYGPSSQISRVFTINRNTFKHTIFSTNIPHVYFLLWCVRERVGSKLELTSDFLFCNIYTISCQDIMAVEAHTVASYILTTHSLITGYQHHWYPPKTLHGDTTK